MRACLLAIGLLSIFSLVAPLARADDDAQARERVLAERVHALVQAHPEIAGAHVGIAAVDVGSGRTLVSIDAAEPFQIASNAKLVTSAAALALLGPAYRFRTTLAVDRWDGGDSAGNLYLRGGADPSLDEAGLREQLAHGLRLMGITRLGGALIIDDSFFDADSMPPAFAQKSEDAGFRAPVSAASLNYNAVSVWVKPGAAVGSPARVILSPASDAVSVVSTAVTSGAGETQIDIHARERGDGKGTEITVSGSIRVDDHEGYEERKRIDHPAWFLAGAFRAVLAESGIHVDARMGVVPAAAKVIAVHESEPLSLLLREMEKYSNNFMAETVLKTLGAESAGAPGTWKAGVAAVTGWLGGIGVPVGTYRYENGSGLYDSNRFTAGQVAAVLRAAAVDFRTGADYLAALSIAGADGTLAHRMLGGAAERYVRAKTGTINGVSCLSGFAGGNGGTGGAVGMVAFSVLVNGLPVGKVEAVRGARAVEDGVAELLVRYVEGGL